MDNSVLYMQQQAQQRVQRMQEHARRIVESDNYSAPRPSCIPDTPPAATHNSEQMMLLTLALLLHQSKARPELLIALLYLAM